MNRTFPSLAGLHYASAKQVAVLRTLAMRDGQRATRGVVQAESASVFGLNARFYDCFLFGAATGIVTRRSLPNM